ncbi:polygalacturonase [Limimaricola variabilis]|uniref:Polygalacturonase n=1 Tax=Limimaricola variabilis TaxID=1492771 RepID=A0ABR6HSX5_9RHOB|nr:glycoside hydrolase family 28 protein [Limimaricola variabilis]MBB3713577.1 polygalacturonase [Limimaricola variabilis]
MSIQLAARSARSVALCLTRPGARFHLDPPLPWRLRDANGAVLREGVSAAVPLALHGLTPDTVFEIEAEGLGRSGFRTRPCAGLVEATDHGLRPGLDDTAANAAANARAFSAAIAATPKGGTLRLGAGRWICAPVRLHSHLTLWLDAGAELSAPSDRAGWPILPARGTGGAMLGSWEGLPADCFAAPLHAVGAQDLTIDGPGALDGGGDRGDWWAWPKGTRDGARRPRGLHLIDCRDVTLLGFSIRNAPSWTIHPQGCDRLTAAHLSISAPHDSPNTDGFNPEMCREVAISGTRFSVGDDCIAIKAGKRGPAGAADHLRETRGVVIRHCLMERGHGGVVIGSEMSGGVSDVVVEACEMEGTDRGLRLKTRRGRGGAVENVTMRDVSMTGVATAISANAFYHCDADGHDGWVQSRGAAPVDETTPRIGAITVERLQIAGLAHAAGAFLGLPERPLGPVLLRDVTIESLDEEACAEAPVMADHLRKVRHAGLLIENAELRAEPALPIDGTLTRETEETP